MDVEHEMCGNCKKEIPQHNYVMHSAHCARNITLCQTCKEPIPKSQFEEHKQKCIVKPKAIVVPKQPPSQLERSQYFQQRKSVEAKKAEKRLEQKIEKYDRLVDSGYSLKSSSSPAETYKANKPTVVERPIENGATSKSYVATKTASKPSGLLACKFCDLELPKLELDEHENYCGSRTDKCLECGELVMFKYKQIHMDSNHGFLKLKDEPGPRPSWDSSTQRTAASTESSAGRRSNRPEPFSPFTTNDSALYALLPSVYLNPPQATKVEKGESYKEISRRLDCKTEYIRNLLHDSASITVPLRHNGAVPRNHFNHNKAGPAPQPPRRRPNPPTELTIPCEFCATPIPHEDLIQHETGCRPDLARYNPRRRVLDPEEDDYFVPPPEDYHHHQQPLYSYRPSMSAQQQPQQQQRQQPNSPEVELPCEFCSDMIPASQLLRHQATCA